MSIAFLARCYRHPNIPQLFGVCTSTAFPALIFHQDAARKKTVEQHRSSLALFEVLIFDLQLMSDIQSASTYLRDFFEGIRESIVGPDTTYVDGNGRVIYEKFRRTPATGPDAWLQSVFCLLETYIRRPSYNFSHPRWKSLIKGLQNMKNPSFIHKDNLLLLYEMIYAFVVGKECVVGAPKYDDLYLGGHIIRENVHGTDIFGVTQVASLPFDLKSIQWTLSYLGTNDDEDIIPVEGIRLKLRLSQLQQWVCVRPTHLAFPDAPGSRLGQQCIERLIYAWFAQCSQLTGSKGQIDALLLDVEFMINIDWRFGHCYDAFQLCDTFIASDDELSDDVYLCIYPPKEQADKPELRWSLDSDMADTMSCCEAYSVLGISTQIYVVYTSCKLFTNVYNAIQDLHRAYGFDPEARGSDICERYGLPRMEFGYNSKPFFAPISPSPDVATTQARSTYIISKPMAKSLPFIFFCEAVLIFFLFNLFSCRALYTCSCPYLNTCTLDGIALIA